MNPRILNYVIVVAFLTFYRLFLYIEGYPLYRVPLAVIGILIGLQMIRLLMLPENKIKRNGDKI